MALYQAEWEGGGELKKWKKKHPLVLSFLSVSTHFGDCLSDVEHYHIWGPFSSIWKDCIHIAGREQFNFDLISCQSDLQWAASRGVYMKCPILMAPISQSVPVVFVNEKMSII